MSEELVSVILIGERKLELARYLENDIQLEEKLITVNSRAPFRTLVGRWGH